MTTFVAKIPLGSAENVERSLAIFQGFKEEYNIQNDLSFKLTVMKNKKGLTVRGTGEWLTNHPDLSLSQTCQFIQVLILTFELKKSVSFKLIDSEIAGRVLVNKTKIRRIPKISAKKK